MEPIFTLPYPEHAVIEELSKHFPKKEGYSILVPSSRQQKGFDLVIYKNKKPRKSLTIQIKSSRTYKGNPHKKRSKYPEKKFYTWFNTFHIDKGYSDYYVLFGLYTKSLYNKKLDKSRKMSKWYSHILLLFNEEEMMEFLKKLTTKKGDKQDSKFSFGFDKEDEVFLTRGSIKPKPLNKFLFKNKVDKLKGRFS